MGQGGPSGSSFHAGICSIHSTAAHSGWQLLPVQFAFAWWKHFPKAEIPWNIKNTKFRMLPKSWAGIRPVDTVENHKMVKQCHFLTIHSCVLLSLLLSCHCQLWTSQNHHWFWCYEVTVWSVWSIWYGIIMVCSVFNAQYTETTVGIGFAVASIQNCKKNTAWHGMPKMPRAKSLSAVNAGWIQSCQLCAKCHWLSPW